MLKSRVLLGLSLLIVTVFTACSSGSTASPTATPIRPASSGPTTIASKGEALVNERCSVCHDASRIKTTKKTPDEWRATVDMMVSKGARLNAEEKTEVVRYLSETYKK